MVSLSLPLDCRDTRDANTVMTSVSGHLMNQDFDSTHKSWASCAPEELFSARILSAVSNSSKEIAQNIQKGTISILTFQSAGELRYFTYGQIAIEKENILVRSSIFYHIQRF